MFSIWNIRILPILFKIRCRQPQLLRDSDRYKIANNNLIYRILLCWGAAFWLLPFRKFLRWLCCSGLKCSNNSHCNFDKRNHAVRKPVMLRLTLWRIMLIQSGFHKPDSFLIADDFNCINNPGRNLSDNPKRNKLWNSSLQPDCYCHSVCFVQRCLSAKSLQRTL